MILMTKEFDILAEQTISTENQVESTFVNVGWGSYETQFKGSDGKKAVKEKASSISVKTNLKLTNNCFLINRLMRNALNGMTKAEEFAGEAMENIML